MDDKNSTIKCTISMKLAPSTHQRFIEQARERGSSQNNYLQSLMDIEEKILSKEKLPRIQNTFNQDRNRYMICVKNAEIEIEVIRETSKD